MVAMQKLTGKLVEAVVEESGRPASGILSTYRYCLERGYITNPDSVLPLTADLLLRRTELTIIDADVSSSR